MPRSLLSRVAASIVGGARWPTGAAVVTGRLTATRADCRLTGRKAERGAVIETRCAHGLPPPHCDVAMCAGRECG